MYLFTCPSLNVNSVEGTHLQKSLLTKVTDLLTKSWLESTQVTLQFQDCLGPWLAGLQFVLSTSVRYRWRSKGETCLSIVRDVVPNSGPDEIPDSKPVSLTNRL